MKTTKISSFLKERQDRFKPVEANKLGLMRLNKIDFSGKIHLVDKPTKTNMILVKKGDLVISGINIEKGAVAIYQGDEDILATIHYSSYEFDEDKINVEYFKWFLKSKTFKDIVNSQIGGGIKTELKPKKFLPLEINLPTISEQKQILKKIQSMEKEIKQLEQNVSHDKKILSSLRQSILSEAVQGKLALQNPKDEPASELLKKIKKEKEKLIKEGKIRKGKELPVISTDEIPYELPKGWEWCRLGEVLEFINGDRGKNYPSKEKLSNEGIPFISAINLQGGTISTNNLLCVSEEQFNKLGSGKLRKNDLVFCIRGSLGKSCVYPFEQGAIASSLVILRQFNFSEIFLKYLTCYINSPLTFDEIRKYNNGTAQPNLAANNFKNFLFPIPPLPEQKRIVAKVDELMKFCDELELRIKENKRNSELLMVAVLRESFR